MFLSFISNILNEFFNLVVRYEINDAGNKLSFSRVFVTFQDQRIRFYTVILKNAHA